MGGTLPKQYLPLAGRTILEHTLDRFVGHPRIAGVVLALAADDRHWQQLPAAVRDQVITVAGGAERVLSVLSCLHGLAPVAAAGDRVMVHDAARPCVRPGDIDRLLDAGMAHPVGAILAQPVRDTMKRADAANVITGTVDRTGLWHALTPQLFSLAALTGAIESALQQGVTVTDESQAMETQGMRPLLVRGQLDNIKITDADDLPLAELFLARQREEGCV